VVVDVRRLVFVVREGRSRRRIEKVGFGTPRRGVRFHVRTVVSAKRPYPASVKKKPDPALAVAHRPGGRA
jgi:hypothetical protein